MNRFLLRKIIRDLMGRKTSLVALVVIMAFGTGSFIGFLSVQRDLEHAAREYGTSNRLADFIVTLKRMPAPVADELAALPNVEQVRGRVSLSALVEIPGQLEPISGQVISLPPHPLPIITDVKLIRGSWFTDDAGREVIINDAFAKANNLGPGDRIKVILLDKQHEMLIVGTAISPEFVYLIPNGGGIVPDPARFGSIYLPERFLQESGDLDGAYNQILGRVQDRDPAQLKATLEMLKTRLDQYGVLLAGAQDDEPSQQFLNNELINLKKSSTITPVVFLTVAALMLNVLVARLVAQQRSVIGTLKAIGYSSPQIFAHYVGYGVVLGVAGGLAGAFLGNLVHSGMLALYRHIFAIPVIPFRMHWDIFAWGMTISFLSASLGTIKGVRQAIRLAPAEAMHPPPPERGRAVVLERFPALWNRLSFRMKMVFRDIFRNPFRSAVSLMAGITSTMMVMGALCMRDAFWFLTAYEYKLVSHEDFTLALRDPRGRGFASEERQGPGIIEWEYQLAVPADLTNGNAHRRVNITGMEHGSHLYTPLGRNGVPIVIPETGLILTRKLADILHVKPGDELTLHPLLGERRQTKTFVAGTIDTYVGLSSYGNLDYLSRLLGEEWVSNRVLVRQHLGASRAPLYEVYKQRRSVTGISDRLRSLWMFDEVFGKVNAFVIGVFALFAALIGFASVLNASLVSLSERVREVGTLRVLGYTSRQVAGIFAAESGILYGLGLLIGLWWGLYYVQFLSVAYSSEIFRLPATVSLQRILQTTLIMIVAIGSAQAIVFYLIDRLHWLEALKIKE